MSAMDSNGLVGVSTQISRVCGVIAARTASTSDSATGVYWTSHSGEHLVDQPEGAAVGVVGDDHVVAGPQHRPQRAVGGGHAGTERPPEGALFDGRQRGLQRGPGRVAGARVFESAAQTADTVLGERAAGVDRGVDRPGRRVRPVAGVNGLGGQSGEVVRYGPRSSTISLVTAAALPRPHDHARPIQAAVPVDRQANRRHDLVRQRLPLGVPQREKETDVADDLRRRSARGGARPTSRNRWAGR